MGRTALIYALAALCEIAGCFAIWTWLRLGAPWWYAALGLLALFGFAWLLTLTPTAFAGRAFAAYGGVYVAASLVWMWAVERAAPDRWDLIGAGLVLAGAAVIVLAPRTV